MLTFVYGILAGIGSAISFGSFGESLAGLHRPLQLPFAALWPADSKPLH